MVTHLLLAQGSAKVTVASAPSNPSSQLRAIPAFLLFNSSVLDRSSVAKRSSSCSLLPCSWLLVLELLTSLPAVTRWLLLRSEAVRD